jgi:trehalose/maltose hydrolase-like predicted phosphorylase
VLTDIEIEGPVDDQQAIRSFQTYLRMALPSAGLQPAPLSPHGLSADHYLGHVFWDADVWVFPVLALLDPQAARAIPAYRLHHFGAAKENYTSWWRERQRDGTFQPGAAKFPWQSAVSGGETAHDEFREEVHINGAVLWGLTLAERLGMAESGQVKSVERSLALFWRSLLTPRPGTKQFDIKRVFGVDEFRSTDNDLVTNILAQWTLNGRRHQIPKGISEVYLPRAAGNPIFQTYEGDTQRTFKQAAAVLSIYPYQFPAAEANAKAMMDHYASRIDQRGPAMTEAIHATIWARMGQTEKAYDEWKGAWREFTGALLMFSEHRNRDRSYFATGAAGCLQTVLYGFLGFRIDYKQVPGAVWSLQLKSGGWLSVKPNLPKAWTRVTVRNLQLLGRSYTLEITHNGVQVTEGES